MIPLGEAVLWAFLHSSLSLLGNNYFKTKSYFLKLLIIAYLSVGEVFHGKVAPNPSPVLLMHTG